MTAFVWILLQFTDFLFFRLSSENFGIRWLRINVPKSIFPVRIYFTMELQTTFCKHKYKDIRVHQPIFLYLIMHTVTDTDDRDSQHKLEICSRPQGPVTIITRNVSYGYMAFIPRRQTIMFNSKFWISSNTRQKCPNRPHFVSKIKSFDQSSSPKN